MHVHHKLTPITFPRPLPILGIIPNGDLNSRNNRNRSRSKEVPAQHPIIARRLFNMYAQTAVTTDQVGFLSDVVRRLSLIHALSQSSMSPCFADSPLQWNLEHQDGGLSDITLSAHSTRLGHSTSITPQSLHTTQQPG
jgi:hypothetical protein